MTPPHTVRRIPVDRDQRTDLRAATGAADIPELGADGLTVAGERAILAHRDEHFMEPPDAADQRAEAARAMHEELEAACPKFAAATR